MSSHSQAHSTPSLGTKRAALVGLGVLVALGFMWALKPKPIGVDIERVARGPLAVTVDEEGKTTIKNVYTVSAPIAGKVLRAPVKAGDKVERNVTVVAVIQPPPPSLIDVRSRAELESAAQAAQAALKLAEAELNQAKADLNFAESDLIRAQELSRREVASERTLQKAQMDVETRKAGVAKAEANVGLRKRELESSQVRLLTPDQSFVQRIAETACCYDVKSPESGRVLKLIAESEAVVASGAPLMEIGNPGDLEITAELLSTDAVRLKMGAKAMVDGWGGPPLEAHVIKIYPSGFTKVSALGIEEQRVKVLLGFDGPAEARERLGHDYRVFVRIAVYENPDALRVPLPALFRRGDAWAVFAVENGVAVERRIEIGQRNSSYAEVASGLQEGQSIILHPSDKVANGGAVVAR